MTRQEHFRAIRALLLPLHPGECAVYEFPSGEKQSARMGANGAAFQVFGSGMYSTKTSGRSVTIWRRGLRRRIGGDQFGGLAAEWRELTRRYREWLDDPGGEVAR